MPTKISIFKRRFSLAHILKWGKVQLMTETYLLNLPPIISTPGSQSEKKKNNNNFRSRCERFCLRLRINPKTTVPPPQLPHRESPVTAPFSTVKPPFPTVKSYRGPFPSRNLTVPSFGERESGNGEESEEVNTSFLLRRVRRAREEGRTAFRYHSAPIHFLEVFLSPLMSLFLFLCSNLYV